MRKAFLLGCLALILGGVATTAAPLSGAWSFWMRTEIDPFSITAMESVLEVDYSASSWTLLSTLIADLDGLDNVYYDVSGPVGGFALRSILDFDAEEAQLRTWLASGVTAIGGVNLYATFMLDNVGTAQNASMGSGLTLGGWGRAGDLSIWAQTRFNMTDSSSNLYKYGYEWLLDHFIFEVCDTWQKPSAYLDVQASGFTARWTGADVLLEMPFTRFTALAAVGISCDNGFDSVLFELNDIDLGLDWLDLKWLDVFFTVDSKSVAMVFDLSVAETACITPYLALEGGGHEIRGFSLKALKLAYSWDGVTFKAGHLFDENGWSEYLNYEFYEWGWTWGGELSYLAPCKVPSNYDEYFGLVLDGESCCGGGSNTSLFAWFDTGSEVGGIFDWVETRASVRYGVSANLDVSFAMSLTNGGIEWLKTGLGLSW